MNTSAQNTLASIISSTLRLLTRRDIAIQFGITIVRYLVNLLDLAGVTILALAVNFLISVSAPTGLLGDLYDILNIGVDASGSKLLALFYLGSVALAVFILKAVLSVALLNISLKHIAMLETMYSTEWLTQLSTYGGKVSVKKRKGEITHIISIGAQSIFQRIVAPIATFAAESASLITVLVVLGTVQPLLTATLVFYFLLISVVMQKIIGRKLSLASVKYRNSFITYLQEAENLLRNRNHLVLSGRLVSEIESFREEREVASASNATIIAVSNYPRYVIETALIAGAFALAGLAFLLMDPLSAATTLTFFLTTAARMTPSVVNMLGCVSQIQSASADLIQTKAILAGGGFPMEKQRLESE
jgi:ATP-binding cassette, subfamily B, bacterial PglK